ncbi:MAG: deoxynucleoside kinase [Chitinophagales bacterium]|nr:deoxynucleoside kinase [Bacteroidota bacterium]MBP9221999.1 deoxynucleoside kinase [Chitinophagales bacterium]MBP9796961.1 deoxynucleoside kinase [Chitinophagales bacterium]
MQRRIITVEGNIGSGKTSFAKKLAAAYNAKLILETFADNPFLQKFFVKQQDYALGMEMFFMAERYEQLKSELTEAENINDIFVIDYLFTKSLLYAKVNLDDAEYGLYQKIFNILNPKVLKSDLVIYLHSNLDRLVSNIYQRGREFELSVKKEYLKKIEEVYLNEFERFADQTTLILDVSNADFVAVDADFQKMLVLIDKQHEPGIHRYTI